MVRKAVVQDLVFITELVHKFNKEYFEIELDPDKTEEAILNLILRGSVFVSPTGFIGGIVVPDIFRNRSYLHELGWYATDSSGYKLLRAFVDEAKRLEVDEVRMCTLNTSPPAAAKLLTRMGFMPIEQSYKLDMEL